MLPSFRLIAATFLCGFVVVFAGLRLASSLNDIHEGLPVMAAHAAPVSITPVADREARRSLAAVPLMYDMRSSAARWRRHWSGCRRRLSISPPAAFDRAPEDIDRESSLKSRAGANATKEAAEPDTHGRGDPPAAPVAPWSAVSPDALSPSPPAPKRRPSPPSTRRRLDATPAEQPAAATPAAAHPGHGERAAIHARAAIEESLPNPDAAATHRPRRRPPQRRIPSPTPRSPLPPSQPRNPKLPSPKLPSHRLRNPRRPRGQGRPQEADPCRPPRRADEPPGQHLRQFERRLRHLARHRAALTSPVIRHGKSRCGTLTVCHDSPFRSFARHHRHLRPAGAAQQHRPRPSRRPAGLHPLSGWPSITTCRTSRARRPTS